MAKSERTKALEIAPDVKDAVYSRDNGRCIICGQAGQPNAHYISRAHGGLGIEENIVTLCSVCHRLYDQSEWRERLGKIIGAYLRGHYPGWDEKNLTYRKGRTNVKHR